MSYSVHVHTPDPQSSDPATAGTARTGNRAAYGRILALALPTFGQLIAEPTFVLIDTAIVGHIGVSALAGLSIGSTIILTAVGLCIFLAYSTTAQVAPARAASAALSRLMPPSTWMSSSSLPAARAICTTSATFKSDPAM